MAGFRQARDAAQSNRIACDGNPAKLSAHARHDDAPKIEIRPPPIPGRFSHIMSWSSAFSI
jgi:hypothetical protein